MRGARLRDESFTSAYSWWLIKPTSALPWRNEILKSKKKYVQRYTVDTWTVERRTLARFPASGYIFNPAFRVTIGLRSICYRCGPIAQELLNIDESSRLRCANRNDDKFSLYSYLTKVKPWNFSLTVTHKWKLLSYLIAYKREVFQITSTVGPKKIKDE